MGVARLVYGLITGRERENLSIDDEELYLDLRRSKSSYANYYNKTYGRKSRKGDFSSKDKEKDDAPHTEISPKGSGGIFGKLVNVVSTVASTALNAVMIKKAFPPERQTLIVFVVGGITCEEVKEISEVLKENQRQRRDQRLKATKVSEREELKTQEDIEAPKVILMSTTLSSPNSLHYHLFENLSRRDS